MDRSDLREGIKRLTLGTELQHRINVKRLT